MKLIPGFDFHWTDWRGYIAIIARYLNFVCSGMHRKLHSYCHLTSISPNA